MDKIFSQKFKKNLIIKVNNFSEFNKSNEKFQIETNDEL